jgi:hypothetical protein
MLCLKINKEYTKIRNILNVVIKQEPIIMLINLQDYPILARTGAHVARLV